MQMEVISQEGYLIWVDKVPTELSKGMVMMSEAGEQVMVVYVDRSEELVGILPVSQL